MVEHGPAIVALLLQATALAACGLGMLLHMPAKGGCGGVRRWLLGVGMRLCSRCLAARGALSQAGPVCDV